MWTCQVRQRRSVVVVATWLSCSLQLLVCAVVAATLATAEFACWCPPLLLFTLLSTFLYLAIAFVVCVFVHGAAKSTSCASCCLLCGHCNFHKWCRGCPSSPLPFVAALHFGKFIFLLSVFFFLFLIMYEHTLLLLVVALTIVVAVVVLTLNAIRIELTFFLRSPFAANFVDLLTNELVASSVAAHSSGR